MSPSSLLKRSVENIKKLEREREREIEREAPERETFASRLLIVRVIASVENVRRSEKRCLHENQAGAAASSRGKCELGRLENQAVQKNQAG